MYKLLLIITLSLSTVAWAQLAGNNMISGEQTSNHDFYNQTLAAQVNQYTLQNAVIAPSAKEFVEPAVSGEQPGAMAANEGSQHEDWYGQKVAVQAELNRRVMKAEAAKTF